MKVHIWSREHRGYWRDHCQGYTPLKSEAGTYELEEAAKICRAANQFLEDEEAPEETIVPT